MFSNRLKELRQEKGLIQERFAQELNVSKGAVAMWETGKRIPDSEMLKAIAKFFSVSVDYLLGESKFRNNEELIKYNEDRANWGINDPYFEAAFDFAKLLTAVSPAMPRTPRCSSGSPRSTFFLCIPLFRPGNICRFGTSCAACRPAASSGNSRPQCGQGLAAC